MAKKYFGSSELTREMAAKRLNIVLTNLGKNATDVGRETPVDTQRMYKVLRAASYLSVDAYYEICKKYNINMNFLISLQNNMFNEMSEEELKEQQNYKELYIQARGEVTALKETIEILKDSIQGHKNHIVTLKEQLGK